MNRSFQNHTSLEESLTSKVEETEAFLIDLDGTIFKGNTVINGVKETIEHLHSFDKHVLFLSNRGNISREMCMHKLNDLGIRVAENDIIFSSYVAAQFLKAHYPAKKIWVLGEQGLVDEMEIAGLKLASRPTDADWLVISLHEKVTYEDLNQAFQAVNNGARILATNSDKSYPTEQGNAIDVRGMIGAIEASTDHRVDIVVGKPSHFIVKEALKRLNLPPEKCMIIGDSLESDISMGELFGFSTTLVLSGGTKLKQLESSHHRPDFVIVLRC